MSTCTRASTRRSTAPRSPTFCTRKGSTRWCSPARSRSSRHRYTVLDAHVRHYGTTVLRDAVIPMDRELGEGALKMMSHNMGARILTPRQWRNEVA